RRKHPPRRKLLTGLIKCAECGSTLQSDGRNAYRCLARPQNNACGNVTIQKASLDALITDAVVYRLSSPAVPNAPAKPKRQRKQGEDPAALEAELEDLAAMLGRGELTVGEWRAMRPPLEERLAKARAALPTSAAPAVASIVKAPDISKAWESRD